MHKYAFSPVILLSLLFGLTLSVLAQEPQPEAELSTPQRIEAAFERGDIDRDTANLYLAYALTDFEKLPPEYRSDVPWRGTEYLLQLQNSVSTMKVTETQMAVQALLSTMCSSSGGTLPNSATTPHFLVEYDSIGGGLALSNYTDSLETVWQTEVVNFEWAAPPLLALNKSRYHVRIDALGSGLYGYVSSFGTYAGWVGDNPNTLWVEPDAYASCMVLNRDFDTGFPGTPQDALDATTAHEFNHSIQEGYGALDGSNAAEIAFFEGSATWMEDEVFDGSNDNYNYLWPTFNMCMGEYTNSPYRYWITFRGMTEPYGSGTANGGEQIMQDFWEETSKGTGSNLDALSTAFDKAGTTLADAYHNYAIAVKFNKACSVGGYVYPYCLEEGPDYVEEAGATSVHNSISAIGGSAIGSIPDNYALNWISLPTSGEAYDVMLENTSTGGGQLRGSVVCDTGTALDVTPFSAVAAAGETVSVTHHIDPAGCDSVVAVLTNQAQTGSNPSTCTPRSYQLSLINTWSVITQTESIMPDQTSTFVVSDTNVLAVIPKTGAAATVEAIVSANQYCPERSTGVKRCYEITPNGSLTATLRFYFTDFERNHLSLNRLGVYHYDGSVWDEVGGPYKRGGSGGDQYVEATGIGDYSLFALDTVTSTIYLPGVFKNYTPPVVYNEAIRWNIDKINAPETWDITSGSGVVVAVIDTGVDLDHPDLKANVVSGYDFYNNDSNPDDDNGHGSHVAGIVAGVANNGGIIGVAPRASIMPVKVLDYDGSGYTSDVAAGIRWAADNGADVINMSLGGTASSSTLSNAVDYAYSKGVLIVAAAGNCGDYRYLANGCTYIDQPNYPAALEKVMAVASTTFLDTQSSFSNEGWYVEIAAPGGSSESSIYSADYGGGYQYLMGTSQASPHVAGLAALIWQKNSTYTAEQVRSLIKTSAVDLGNSYKFGEGRIDAAAALGVSVTGLSSVEAAIESPFEVVEPVARSREDEASAYAPGEIIVKFKSGVDSTQTLRTAGLDVTTFRLVGEIPQIGVQRFAVPEGEETALVDALNSLPNVEYAELNYRVWAQ